MWNLENNDNADIIIGVIAQEIEHVAPYVVRGEKGKLHSKGSETLILEVCKDPLIFVLVNAFKELNSRIDALSSKAKFLQK